MSLFNNIPLLQIEDLHVATFGKLILKGVNLIVPRGEVHALMGPNGSGKSTLANVLMGHPSYTIQQGQILFNGQSITHLSSDERAKLGLFLAFQYPVEIPGVSVLNFLRSAMSATRGEDISVRVFRQLLDKKLKALNMDSSFARRNLNEGFSGGEKKRNEILQMAMLKPKLAILDETDSGLDIDALRLVSQAVTGMRSSERSFLVITHYLRILNYLKPDVVHIILDGQLVKTGGPNLADQLEQTGYEFIRTQVGEMPPTAEATEGNL